MELSKRSEAKVYSYQEYKDLVLECADKQTTTGSDPSQERIEATKINAQRMKRIDKQVQINAPLHQLIQENQQAVEWTILSEAWCGDGAQIIPVIAKIAAISPETIDLKIILRDENPEIMDAYLTNGSRSIPKLICKDRESGKVLGTWGPRPAGIVKMKEDFMQQNPGVDHDTFVKNLHLWYAKDGGRAIQHDFEQLVQECFNKEVVAP